MPQVFQVLRCYKCLIFQVHQAKKSHKWECKLCGEKQSIKRHYGIGTGKDCRIHVQKLNCIRGEIDELKCSKMSSNQVSDEESESHLQPEKISIHVEQAHSKWSTYLEDQEHIEETKQELMCLGDAEVVLELPTKRRKQFGKYPRNNCSENSSPALIDTKNINIQVSNTAESIPVINMNNTKSEILPVASKTQSLGKENIKKVTPNRFIPPTINKHSKWAQYTDKDLNLSSPVIESRQCINELNFSLCDDTDLDNVLQM